MNLKKFEMPKKRDSSPENLQEQENFISSTPLFKQFFRNIRIELEHRQNHPLQSSALLRLSEQVRIFLEKQFQKLGLKKLLKKLASTTAMALLMTTFLLSLQNPALQAITFVDQTGDANPMDGITIPVLTGPSPHSKPAFVDIDDDGDMDLFIGGYYGNLYFYKNNGTVIDASFDMQTDQANPLSNVGLIYFIAPAFVDIDNDGDMDVFIGTYDGKIKYYKNNGTASDASFDEQTTLNNPLSGVIGEGNNRFSTPTFVDIDNDGDMDAFIGNVFGTIRHYKNNGTATDASFDAQIGSANPLDAVAVGDGYDGGGYSTPTFVDVDHDGDMDLFVGEFYGEIQHYKNNGTATAASFDAMVGSGNNPLDTVDVGPDPGPAYSAPVFVNIDNDGDLDVFFGEYNGTIIHYKNTTVDTFPPFFSWGHPMIEDLTSDGFTITAQLSEPGRVYYVVLPDGTTVPSLVQLKAGTDSNDLPALKFGSILINLPNRSFNGMVSELSSETAYDVYLLAEDAASTPNLQTSVIKLNVTTDIGTDVFTNSPPTTPQLVSPDDGVTELSRPVSVVWEVSIDPDGDSVSYTVEVCKDEAFTDSCLTVTPNAAMKAIATYGGFGGFGAVLFLLAGRFFRKARNRSRLVKGVLITLLLGGLMGSCKRSTSSSDENSTSVETKSATLTDLDANTTYFWKVVVTDEKDGTTESSTRSFTTASE